MSKVAGGVFVTCGAYLILRLIKLSIDGKKPNVPGGYGHVKVQWDYQLSSPVSTGTPFSINLSISNNNLPISGAEVVVYVGETRIHGFTDEKGISELSCIIPDFNTGDTTLSLFVYGHNGVMIWGDENATVLYI